MQQVLSGSSDDRSEGIKKRKLAVPASARAAFTKGKTELGRQLTGTYISVGTKKVKVVKGTSKVVLSPSRKSSRRASAVDRLTAAMQKGSNLTLNRKTSASLSSKEVGAQVTERRGNVKAAAASVRRNVVRTVRGSRRAAAAARIGNNEQVDELGRTIKVIDGVGS